MQHSCPHCAGHLATVQLLIKRKANVAATDRKGSTALDLATDPAVREALQQALQTAQQPQVRRPLHQTKLIPSLGCAALVAGGWSKHDMLQFYAVLMGMVRLHRPPRQQQRSLLLAQP